MVKRIFVEKKSGYDVSAQKVRSDVNNVLGIAADGVRVFIRYDVEGLEKDIFDQAKTTIFSEPPVDDIYEDALPALDG